MAGTQSPEYKRLLDRLKAARRDAGLTQADVARKLGRPQSYVSKCESGERRIDVIELEAFARLYRRTLASFLPKGPRG